jgi:ribosomal protein S1
MGWAHVSDALQVVKPGDQITVKVLRVDADKQKISLGLRQLKADPWAKVAESYQAGQLRVGRVARVAEFGAFVELEPGVEGLLPLSESGVGRDTDVKKAFPIGTSVEVVILDVDAEARRIRLSVTAVEERREADEVRQYTERTDAPPVERFGSLADKLRGALKPPQK